MTVDYRPPRRPRRALDIPPSDRDRVRDCTSCRRTLAVARYYPRFADDPYGVAANAVARYHSAQRKGGREPTQAGEALAIRGALALGVPRNKMLRLQPLCIDCTRARARRRAHAASLGVAGYSVDLTDDRALTARVSPQLSGAQLERSAATGLVCLGPDGRPDLPAHPVEALRVCYAALCATIPAIRARRRSATTPKVEHEPVTSSRAGYLGPDREALLHAVEDLAAAAAGHVLARRSQDVVDCALVRDGGRSASAAMTRLLRRYRPRIAGQTRASVARTVRAGHLTREDMDGRINEAILYAAQRWDPLHSSTAAYATVVNTWAQRTTEDRTRGEHRIGQRQDPVTGHWTAPAVELVRAGKSSKSDDSYEVVAGTYTHGVPPVRPDAAMAEIARVAGVRADVRGALATLTACERNIVTRRLLGGETWQRISRDLGMSPSAIQSVLAGCLPALQSILGHHGNGATS